MDSWGHWHWYTFHIESVYKPCCWCELWQSATVAQKLLFFVAALLTFDMHEVDFAVFLNPAGKCTRSLADLGQNLIFFWGDDKRMRSIVTESPEYLKWSTCLNWTGTHGDTQKQSHTHKLSHSVSRMYSHFRNLLKCWLEWKILCLAIRWHALKIKQKMQSCWENAAARRHYIAQNVGKFCGQTL